MKQNKRRRDIKSRLIAAVCMLMVSVIMMVSSSYAWFTLSTAPEVKGIQTAVGANGNLEIALLSTANSFSSPDQYISSAVGDSSSAANKSAITANVTWGNLVDLSDSSYGLSMISLLPSKLDDQVILGRVVDASSNVTYTRNHTLTDMMLAVPTYGADGRVNEVTAENTIVAPFNYATSTFGQVITDTTNNPSYNPSSTIEYGVRAVGTSSNRSLREITYDTSLAQAGILASQFRTDAIASLQANGNGLASLGTKHANDANATFTQAEVNVLQAVVDSILGSRILVENEETGAMEWKGNRANDGLVYVATQAAGYYSAAAFASSLNTAEYANDKAYTDAATTTAIADFAATVPELKALETAIASLAAKATAAQAGIPSGKTSYVWTDISAAVGQLFDSSAMDVWGYQIGDLVDKMNTPDGLAEIMDLYAANNNKIVANIKGGVFSLMADMCADFSVTTGLYLNETYKNMPTTMIAKKTASSVALNAASAVVAAKPAPKGAGDSPKISDAYGYVVDLAFRTNASESNLLLQTAGTQRISSSTSDSTQGGGSTMTFRSSDENFTVDQMANLMKSIVVVFYAPGTTSNTVLCTAKLDMGTTPRVDASGNPVMQTVKDAQGNDVEQQIMDPNYTVNATSKTITANLYIVGYEYSYDEATDTVTQTGTSLIKDQTQAVITALDANTAQKVSVLVYLDGETVTNKDVAVGSSSMTGTMNLQFSSSANLVPMSYNGTLGPANDVVRYDVTTDNQSTGFSINASGSALMGRDYTFTVTGEGTPTVAVEITTTDEKGGTTTTTVTPTKAGNEYTIPATNVTGTIKITVTGTADTGTT